MNTQKGGGRGSGAKEDAGGTSSKRSLSLLPGSPLKIKLKHQKKPDTETDTEMVEQGEPGVSKQSIAAMMAKMDLVMQKMETATEIATKTKITAEKAEGEMKKLKTEFGKIKQQAEGMGETVGKIRGDVVKVVTEAIVDEQVIDAVAQKLKDKGFSHTTHKTQETKASSINEHREVQVILGGFDEDSDCDHVEAEINKFIEANKLGRKVTKVSTLDDPARFGVIQFETIQAKITFFKKVSGMKFELPNGKVA